MGVGEGRERRMQGIRREKGVRKCMPAAEEGFHYQLLTALTS